MSLADLPGRWREEAVLLRRYAAEAQAITAERHAAELEEALGQQADELLDLQEASRISGYSPRRLRELSSEGRLRNHGRRGVPRFRRADLPRKPRRRAPGFDARAEAARLVEQG